jgi:hypothetical protein
MLGYSAGKGPSRISRRRNLYNNRQRVKLFENIRENERINS